MSPPLNMMLGPISDPNGISERSLALLVRRFSCCVGQLHIESENPTKVYASLPSVEKRVSALVEDKPDSLGLLAIACKPQDSHVGRRTRTYRLPVHAMEQMISCANSHNDLKDSYVSCIQAAQSNLMREAEQVQNGDKNLPKYVEKMLKRCMVTDSEAKCRTFVGEHLKNASAALR